jgi:hypothetical protein
MSTERPPNIRRFGSTGEKQKRGAVYGPFECSRKMIFSACRNPASNGSCLCAKEFSQAQEGFAVSGDSLDNTESMEKRRF